MFYFLFMMIGFGIGYATRGHVAQIKSWFDPRNWFRKADQQKTTSHPAK